jgi:hypothetical protein
MIVHAMVSGLDAGLMLDRQWHLLRGEMERTKEPTLLSIGHILDEAGVAYAIIGGVAAQIHLPEPRTTLDIDLAVVGCDTIPRDRLEAAGFAHHGRFVHSENWRGPDGTPVQFTDDPALAHALATDRWRDRMRATGRCVDCGEGLPVERRDRSRCPRCARRDARYAASRRGITRLSPDAATACAGSCVLHCGGHTR